MKSRPSQVVQGLVDGIEVLHELAASPEPVLGGHLAEKLRLHPVRVNRLLMTFNWLGITRRDKAHRYAPGPGMHLLAAQSLAASGLLGRGVEGLTPLLDESVVVAIGVLGRDKVTFLYHRNPGSPPLSGVRQWVTPASNSSIGMVLLAEQSDEQILRLYAGRGELPGLYKTTDDLLAALHTIRSEGRAVLRHPTHTSMAFAIGEPAIAAVAVSGPEVGKREDHFDKLLRAVARDIAEPRPDPMGAEVFTALSV